jgi:MurNAc alpha-1-phosphate uridylyltransferase
MKAMILAAGRGERMRPLTDACPKPLLEAGGKPLIVWHLERLAAAGFVDVVINHAHLGARIEERLGDGARWGLRLAYSAEPVGALETAGGIRNALELLGDAHFLVINGDIWCDWDPAAAPVAAAKMRVQGDLAWLLLTANPPQHPQGDFTLENGSVGNGSVGRLTFSGVGIYDPALFAAIERGRIAPLAPLLRQAIAAGKVSGERHTGRWTDVGTAQRLAELDAELRRQRAV